MQPVKATHDGPVLTITFTFPDPEIRRLQESNLTSNTLRHTTSVPTFSIVKPREQNGHSLAACLSARADHSCGDKGGANGAPSGPELGASNGSRCLNLPSVTTSSRSE